MSKPSIIWLSVLLSLIISFQSNATETETAELKAQITAYHHGLIKQRPELTTGALADSFFMANGNFSADPLKWQAHLYLHGDDVKTWVKNMINMAAPHKNKLEFLNFNVRGGSALVVSKETGSNKFRKWQDEVVVYSLGKVAGKWQIVSLFIRDIKNP